MMRCLAKIIENKLVLPDFYEMNLLAPEAANLAAPGQFLHVRTADGYSPLLRRPLSLHDIDRVRGRVGLLYQVRGTGTLTLSKKTAGEEIDLMGPLGRGFCLDFPGDHALLVGGGIGVAPLYPLAIALIRQGKQVTLLLGGRSAGSLLGEEKFLAAGCEVKTATNDGSRGTAGYVTKLFEDHIQGSKADVLYVCGPAPMLSRVEAIALKMGIPGQVSLEEYMGCGVGACLSCACEKKSPGPRQYAKVCTDGPVFSFGEVKISHES